MSKVLVYSKHREGVVAVGRKWDKDGNVALSFRQFRPLSPKSQVGKCYMRPEEAVFVVESKESRKQEASGEPSYWYPMGIPIPVADDEDGPMMPPITQSNAHVEDARQTLAAQEVEIERAAAMKAAQAEHDRMLASGEISDPEADENKSKQTRKQRAAEITGG